jgi:putative peptidoglycan binding protein
MGGFGGAGSHHSMGGSVRGGPHVSMGNRFGHDGRFLGRDGRFFNNHRFAHNDHFFDHRFVHNDHFFDHRFFHHHHNIFVFDFVSFGFPWWYPYPYYYGYPYYGYPYDYSYSDYGSAYDYRYWNDLAMSVQSELARRGYYSGSIDGAIGPSSRKAIRAFQAAQGLPVTGIIDAKLLKALGISYRTA